ncbi:SAM-dependent methyltransferase [Spirillospora albida]|uniref:SAM-dependent methyltransferase n=1 Tax=Spirillospora albida TaxID=58123 RepID=UPI00068D0A41|nr:SAM-dependent methyltransferase [Spirillospora albida]
MGFPAPHPPAPRHGRAAERPRAGPPLDLTGPSSARVTDCLLGGKDNYAADRELAERVLAALPQAATAARAGRAFLARAVADLTARGIRQFVDLGCGLPTSAGLHRLAGPGARCVYIDHDPLVIAHTRALLIGDGELAALRADLRDPAAILASPEMRRLIDPAEPVALVFSSVLDLLPDPWTPVSALGAAAPPGSAMVITHVTADFAPAACGEAARLCGAAGGFRLFPRGAGELRRLLGPFTPLPPGVVPVAEVGAPAGLPPVLYGVVGVR